MSQGSGHPPRGLGEVTPMPVEAAHGKVFSNAQTQQEGTVAASSKPSHQKPSFVISSAFCFASSRASESDGERKSTAKYSSPRENATPREDMRDLHCHLYILPPIWFVFPLPVCLSVYHLLIYKLTRLSESWLTLSQACWGNGTYKNRRGFLFYFVIGFHYVAQTGLEFAHSSLASIFQVLELEVYATMPRL